LASQELIENYQDLEREKKNSNVDTNRQHITSFTLCQASHQSKLWKAMHDIIISVVIFAA